jgi:hypothetical protein
MNPRVTQWLHRPSGILLAFSIVALLAGSAQAAPASNPNHHKSKIILQHHPHKAAAPAKHSKKIILQHH